MTSLDSAPVSGAPNVASASMMRSVRGAPGNDNIGTGRQRRVDLFGPSKGHTIRAAFNDIQIYRARWGQRRDQFRAKLGACGRVLPALQHGEFQGLA